MKEILIILAELYGWVKARSTPRVLWLLVIFIMLWAIAAYNFELRDAKFWCLTEPGESPDPPIFLDKFFWYVFGGSSAVALLLFSISKLIGSHEDSFILVRYLDIFIRILAWISVIPIGFWLLYLFLYFFLLAAQLTLVLAGVLVLSYFSAQIVDELLRWVGFERQEKD